MKTRVIYLILMGLIFTIRLSAQENAFPLKSSLWHSTSISVCWDNPTPENEEMREIVKQAITETWQKYSALQFTEWCPATSKDCDIHIFISDDKDAPHTIGLGNTIKNKPKGMILNFTFNNWSYDCKSDRIFCIKAIAVHEFGHAIGFAHEQNRKDCSFPNCFKQEQGTNGDWYLTSCDLHSIMNYCNPLWNNNGILSTLDIQAVQYLYGAPPDKSNEFVNPKRIVQNSEYAGTKNNKKRYNFKIYVSATAEDLDKIESVSYNLDDADGTFKKSSMSSDDKYSNFGIGLLKVWGEFDIKVSIKYKDGTKKELIHHLIIDK